MNRNYSIFLHLTQMIYNIHFVIYINSDGLLKLYSLFKFSLSFMALDVLHDNKSSMAIVFRTQRMNNEEERKYHFMQ